MSQFLYFFPDVPSVTQAVIDSVGLQGIVTRTGGRSVNMGPGGFNGVIIGNKAGAGYHPEKQTWCAAPQGNEDNPPYWVGFDTDAKPTPETLQRDSLLQSKPVTLCDGSVWQVPVLCEWQPGKETPAIYQTPLPLMIDIDRYGNAVSGPVIPKYRDLFEVGLKILACMVAGKDDSPEPLTENQFRHFATDVLGCNYRVSLLELSSSLLDCLSTEDAKNIVRAAVDLKGYLECLGNWVGRQGRPDTDSPSGSDA